MLEPLIHIGYHKTGSTLLQESIFQRQDLGFYRLLDDRKRVHPLFIQHGPFERIAKSTIKTLHKEAETASQKGCRLVISHERLSGYIASGGFDAALIAGRIKDVFPNAKILIITREQKSMLYSYYLQYLSDGGDLTLNKLVRDSQPNLFRQPHFQINYFSYVPLIRHYIKLFGASNVCVLPYESMKKDSMEFSNRIVDFTRTENDSSVRVSEPLPRGVNSAHPLLLQVFRRTMNAYLTRNQLSPRGLVNIPYLNYAIDRTAFLWKPFRIFDPFLRRRLSKQVAKICDGEFAKSNLLLQNYVEGDLAKFGYDMGERNSDA